MCVTFAFCCVVCCVVYAVCCVVSDVCCVLTLNSISVVCDGVLYDVWCLLRGM